MLSSIMDHLCSQPYVSYYCVIMTKLFELGISVSEDYQQKVFMQPSLWYQPSFFDSIFLYESQTVEI